MAVVVEVLRDDDTVRLTHQLWYPVGDGGGVRGRERLLGLGFCGVEDEGLLEHLTNPYTHLIDVHTPAGRGVDYALLATVQPVLVKERKVTLKPRVHEHIDACRQDKANRLLTSALV